MCLMRLSKNKGGSDAKNLGHRLAFLFHPGTSILLRRASAGGDTAKGGAVLQAILRKIIEDGAGISLLAMDNFWAFQPWVFPKDAHYSGYQRYFFEETWMAKR